MYLCVTEVSGDLVYVVSRSRPAKFFFGWKNWPEHVEHMTRLFLIFVVIAIDSRNLRNDVGKVLVQVNMPMTRKAYVLYVYRIIRVQRKWRSENKFDMSSHNSKQIGKIISWSQFFCCVISPASVLLFNHTTDNLYNQFRLHPYYSLRIQELNFTSHVYVHLAKQLPDMNQ